MSKVLALRRMAAADVAYSSVHASSVTRALNIVGDRTALLVTYCLFMGIRRFAEMQDSTGVSRSMLSNRLRRLEKQGLLRRHKYQDRPVRYEYQLTAMGRDLYDVALALILWDKRWHFEPDCPNHQLVHQGCGRVFTPQLRCAACDQPVTSRDIEWRQGPGFGVDPHPGPSQSRRSSLSAADLASQNSILVRSLEIIGDRWTAQVIAAAFYRVRHFNEFQQGLGIASNILSDRLERLQNLGVLRRDPAKGDYRLTAKGLDIFATEVCLLRWGDRWLDNGQGPPILLTHRDCGQDFSPKMVCDQCHQGLEYLNFGLPGSAHKDQHDKP